MADEQNLDETPTGSDAEVGTDVNPGSDAGAQDVHPQDPENGAEQPTEESEEAAKGDEQEKQKPDGEKTLLADDVEEDEDGGEEEQAEEEPYEVPEGMQLDKEALDMAMPLFEELGLNRESQQELVTLYSKLVQKAEDRQVTELNEKRAEWRKEIQKDPKHAENLAHAKRALNAFADEGFAAMVKGSWMGDNPDVIGFLSKIGQSLGNDSFVKGGGGGGPKRAEDVLFDDMFDK
ncbi:MAG: hypothetical protein AB7E51_15110 [Pseudodesulfovibrio sp.]|uniref:hypothetical protein n=1 Tax=Pseudodesulfovibrio sp. TaxID=2035812 RepID=UPI003D14A587